MEDPLLDMEGTVARISGFIEEEGLSVESFIGAVGGPYPTSVEEQRAMLTMSHSVYRETVEIIRFIEAGTVGVWGFIFNFLNHRFIRRRPQRHNLRGDTLQSRVLITNILLGIRDVINEAGNGEAVWRAFIQEQVSLYLVISLVSLVLTLSVWYGSGR